MPDLLLELRSEEIPARMQRRAAGDLKKMVTDGLVEAGLTYEAATEYWTPRRLALDIRGLTPRSRDVREERRGPSTGAPEQAIQGFLRSAGLSSVEQAQIRSDPKKGDFYVAVIETPGRAAEDIVAEIVPAVVRDFPWPKSMRWGRASAEPGSLRWVRPLQSILCTFGPETEETRVVDFAVDGIRSGNLTWGHRFHAPEAIEVRRFDDYVASLHGAKVIIDAERRKRIILDDARNLAFASGLELVEDEGLLEEVSGLVEWPVVLMGEFEQEFLDIPAEVIRLTIRANQKCFVTRPQGGGAGLSNRFVLTANVEANDGGKEIAFGNGKVVRARLSDAVHFWKTDQADLPDLERLQNSAARFGLDLAKPLDQRMARLDHLGVTFHARLGTQGERVERIRRLAEALAPAVGADPGLATRAAVLAKADLQTEVVGEFPELQGAMGRRYAGLQGEHPSVAAAIEEHYKPQGPSDDVPADPVSMAVALADKLDTLVGFWAIDEKPTGSKDPYALRRAALGVIRILVENGVRLELLAAWHDAWLAAFHRVYGAEMGPLLGAVRKLGTRLHAANIDHILMELAEAERASVAEAAPGWAADLSRKEADLLSFFHDRLKVYLRDKGAQHDLIDAVLASGGSARIEVGQTAEGRKPDRASAGRAAPAEAGERSERAAASGMNDDLLLVVSRVAALGIFLDTEDGKNLLAGTKRAANILAAEEKKGTRIAQAVDPALLSEAAEKALSSAVNRAEAEAAAAIATQDYAAAMRALAQLRAPVDTFFDAVLVNAEDDAVRANRLALLARIRTATGQVADFSKIAG